MGLAEAVDAPRWLLGKTWGSASVSLKLENRFDPTLIRALEKAGHAVEILPEAYSDTLGHAGMCCATRAGDRSLRRTIRAPTAARPDFDDEALDGPRVGELPMLSMTEDDPVHAFVPYPPAHVASATSGPLSGLTLAVKDIFDVAGYPTGCGQPTKLALSGIKTATAPIVRRFLDAGARFVGKTHTVELAYSLNGINNHFGTPINPAAPDRVPGGSSSGSAAAVAGAARAISASARIRAAQCAGRRAIAASSASARRTTGCRWTARCRLPPHSTRRAGSRGITGHSSASGPSCSATDPHPLPDMPRLLQAEDCFGLAEKGPTRLLDAMVKRIDRMFAPMEGVTAAAPGFDSLYWAFRRLQGVESWVSHGDFIYALAACAGPRHRRTLRVWTDGEQGRGQGIARDAQAAARPYDEAAWARTAC